VAESGGGTHVVIVAISSSAVDVTRHTPGGWSVGVFADIALIGSAGPAAVGAATASCPLIS